MKIATLLLIVGGLSLVGCGGESKNDSNNENENPGGGTTQVTLSHAPFVHLYSREENREDGTNLVAAFWDGIEIPQSHDYLLFGKGSIDRSEDTSQGDNAFFARVSSKDGSLQDATYVRFVNQYGKKNLSEYFRAASLSYYQDAQKRQNIVLVGQSRTDGTVNVQTNGVLVTLLDGDGSHKWSKLYAITDGYLMSIGDVAADSDGTFWVVYNGYVPTEYINGRPQLAYLGVVMHIDARSGDILLAKHIGIDVGESRYSDIAVTDDRIYITGKAIDRDRYEKVLVLELDKDAQLLSANKYRHQNANNLGDIVANGDGVVYKSGKLYIAYERDGIDAGILKTDASSKYLEKAVRLFTNAYGSYYRDFDARGDALYLSANNAGFYKTDLDGNIEKIATVAGGWGNGLFFDAANNTITLSSFGAGARITSAATKFSDKLEYCGPATSLLDPTQNATDVTNEWIREEIVPAYSDLSVAMATDNSLRLEVGLATRILSQESQCDSN